MDLSKIRITYDWRTAVFSQASIEHELQFLNSCSLAFQQLLTSIPDKLPSTTAQREYLFLSDSDYSAVRGIVFTDKPVGGLSGLFPAASNISDGVITIFLNPNVSAVVVERMGTVTILAAWHRTCSLFVLGAASLLT
jgi:hypothetical protein